MQKAPKLIRFRGFLHGCAFEFVLAYATESAHASKLD
jgi:hypothetical protein